MNIISNQDKIGTSKFDLYLFKMLYLLRFKKSKWLKKQIIQITKDIETVKNRKVF
ncbi:hypothetical protein [Oceanobacillus bengalensis]|uniref:hypothetical protein n=1 Tax=Oceanobacillus bengalensis TaxID=1435466 RepID=UPI0015FFE3D8|nr:hypothetical protein [Oceanobacillus bengalensis]